MGQCTGPFLKFVVQEMPAFTQNAWTHQQKVAYLPRPGGGAVVKMGRYYSYYNV